MLARTMHGKPLIYFDSAATAQKPLRVLEVLDRFYREEYGTVHRGVYELAVESSARYEAVRDRVQRFLGAKHREEILFTKGTTDGVNLVAFSFGQRFVEKGDEIVVTAMEHHSNLVPWQMLCERKGAVLRVVAIDQRGDLILDSLESQLNAKTRLVAVTHLSNSLGTINPIREIVAMAHQVGAKVFVDGAQSAAHFPVDVHLLDVDFFAFSGHKLFGPTGIGVLYGKRELLEHLPPYQGGGDMISRVTLERTTYQHPPLKFEAGTPNIAGVLGLGAAIDYLEELGWETVEEREQRLVERLLRGLYAMPSVRMIGEPRQRGSVVSFLVEGAHPLDVGSFLDLRGVAVRTGHHCTQPVMQFYGIQGTVRASVAFYNTAEEVDQFLQILQQAIKILSS